MQDRVSQHHLAVPDRLNTTTGNGEARHHAHPVILQDAIYRIIKKCFLAGYRGICHASLVFKGLCVFEENTSKKWNAPHYPARKHCITTSSEISENFGNASKPFLRTFTIIEKFGNLRNTSKTVQNSL